MNSKLSEILVVTGCYPPDHGGGGLRLHKTYKNLLNRGFPAKITVLTMGGRGTPSGTQEYEGIKVIRVSETAGLSPLRALIKAFTVLFLNNFDLVHGVGNSPPIVVAACLWARWLNITHIRERSLSSTTSSNEKSLKGRILKATYTKADLVMASNDKFEKEFLDIGIPTKRIWTRPHPVDTNIFFFRGDDYRRKAQKKYNTRGKKTHLILAKFRPRKNQLFAVKTLHELPEKHQLLLVGPVSKDQGEYLQEIRDYIEKNNLESRVFIHSYQHKNPVELYHAADTYWLPSISEGMPNVMVEALACGLPVIANKDLGLRRFLEKDTGEFEATLDPHLFAQKVKKACDYSNKYLQRTQLSKITHERFDIEKINKVFYRKLQSLLNNSQNN